MKWLIEENKIEFISSDGSKTEISVQKLSFKKGDWIICQSFNGKERGRYTIEGGKKNDKNSI